MTDAEPDPEVTRLLQLVAERPTDSALRFELAKSLVALERPQEAIPHLQQARQNPHLRKPAMLLCADAFDMIGLPDQADQIRRDFNDPPDDETPPSTSSVVPPKPLNPSGGASAKDHPSESDENS